MIKIGDFSKLSRVSVKMLRHYDEIGLLKPAFVDPFTDYRYYAVEQLPRLNRIVALKDLGFTLEQIARVLDEEVSVEQMRGMLVLKRAEIEQQVRAELTRLARVESRLQQIEQQGTLPAREVVLRHVEPYLAASIRRVIDPQHEDVEPLFDEVERYVEQHKARAAKPPLMLYHDSEHQEKLDVQVAVPLTAPIPPKVGRIEVAELPAVRQMACIIHSGSYSSMAATAAELFQWVASHGYRPSGPTREVFLRFGAAVEFDLPSAYLTTEAAAFMTEFQLPVERIENR
ncbi:MAG: MerR family transcriptional regulator [Anaerolineae bacterium]